MAELRGFRTGGLNAMLSASRQTRRNPRCTRAWGVYENYGSDTQYRGPSFSSLSPVNWHGRLAPCLQLEASQTGSDFWLYDRRSSGRATGGRAVGDPPYPGV